MHKIVLGIVAVLWALSIPGELQAQAAAPRTPRGTATYVTSAEIEATLQKTASAAVSDQALRIVNINDQYNAAVGVVHRAKTVGQPTPNGIEHSEITEVYYVMRGSGTLVTGGTIENPRAAAPDSPTVALLNGPSTMGGAIQGGASRRIGPGDVVIIPPNTPHWFSEITTDEIVYIIMRVDPQRVLPAGYMPN
jgi:mannose-6-phosphate isomerase-like protein (cupin superfamily)